jgi:nucleotide-binding universal stress UspA family protein
VQVVQNNNPWSHVMLKILAPIDGSNNATRVIDHLVALVKKSTQAEVCLINVRDAMDSPQIQRFWSAEQITEFQQKEGGLILESARQRIAEAGVPCTADVLVGDIAKTIADQANAKGCSMIVMGTRGMGTIGNLLMGSAATKVIHLATVPVMLVK